MAATDDPLNSLPETFRYSEALRTINERQLRRLVADGRLIVISRGFYRQSTWTGDDDLIEIAAKSPSATLCLRSALARHDLIDDIPSEMDIAVRRGAWTPQTSTPVRWRHFSSGTFDLGRSEFDAGAGHTIGIYSAERSIVDAFRLAHSEGDDLGREALKRWLRRGGQPSTLLELARSFPRAFTPLRHTLEILL